MNRYLALRDHSRFELQQKLLRRFEAEVVDKVLAEAEERGWLPSEEAVAVQIAAMYARQNKSRRYIEGQLRKRRLPVPAADGDAEVEKVRALLERRFGPPGDLSFEERAKAFRFLKYRGFDDRWIKQVLNEKS
jgi:SOS response regulatory protein OraA/RecX